MQHPLRSKNILIAAVVCGLAIVSSLLLTKNIDFVVYWRGVGEFLSGRQPLYGWLSGNGHPQEFRYPPLTVPFFLPLTRLPLRVAGVVWVLLAWVACAAASALAIRKWNLKYNATGIVLGCLLLAQFVVLFVKFGNVQPHLIALILLALLWAEERPFWSGLALAVATCFKVWPLFFVPWFLIRGRRLALAWAAAASVVFWTAPVLFFGWSGYAFLMSDFFHHVVALASDPESVWYSSQSLRGVLLRLLTHAVPPRDDYPDASLAGMSPALVGGFCLALSAAIYGYAVVATWRASRERRYLWDAAAFAFFSFLQPFAMNSGLISLLPAILVGAHVYSAPPGEFPRAAKRAFLVACGFAALASATLWRPLQRWALMLGVDFWLMLALAAALVIAARGSHAGKA